MANQSKAAKKTSRAGKRDEAALEKLLRDFDAQPARITNEQLDKIEADFLGLSNRRSRRSALLSLTMSGMELIKTVTGDREDALAWAVASTCIHDYVSRLREFADMMEGASTRIGVALCSREDMQAVIAEAEIEASRHGSIASMRGAAPPRRRHQSA